MKITVISGSPHKNGTSATLVREFIRGAEEAGHDVFRFDAAFEDVHPCMACDHYRREGGACVFSDSMEQLNPHLLESDLIAFVTPVYYYNMNAQLRTVIDRFYANNDALTGGKQTVLMMTCEDDTTESVDGPILSYRNMIKYMKWDHRGVELRRCGGHGQDRLSPEGVRAGKESLIPFSSVQRCCSVRLETGGAFPIRLREESGRTA